MTTTNKPNKEIELSRKGFISNYPHFRYWKKREAENLIGYEPVNIYLHVPFCTQHCAYCYYKTEILGRVDQLQEITDAICREIEIASQRYGYKNRPINTIYFGGGTPSLLTGDMFKKIIDTIKENFIFDNPELNMECEPKTVNNKKVRMYKEAGVNRISMGIQSFNDEIIKLSDRHHSGKKALDAIKGIQDIGDIVTNIDLLSGLAGETMETFEESVDTAIGTGIHSITVYKMELYHNTEFFSQSVRKDELKLPTDEQELEFMKMAMKKFEDADYTPWCYFTFTKGGQSAHHYAMNMWRGQDVISFGPSSFGRLGQYNYQNTTDLKGYYGAIEQGKLPIIRAHKLTAKNSMIRDILLGMKLSGMDRKDFVDKHGIDFPKLVPDTTDRLLKGEFITLDDDHIGLDYNGILYGDYVGKTLASAVKSALGEDNLNIL
ncbi:MAG: coproporphyrinogen III oxidase family protein [bacterium]|nr:coproporphyrinogen III oxidase family protein [bacterium]